MVRCAAFRRNLQLQDFRLKGGTTYQSRPHSRASGAFEIFLKVVAKVPALMRGKVGCSDSVFENLNVWFGGSNPRGNVNGGKVAGEIEFA